MRTLQFPNWEFATRTIGGWAGRMTGPYGPDWRISYRKVGRNWFAKLQGGLEYVAKEKTLTQCVATVRKQWLPIARQRWLQHYNACEQEAKR